jgi:hypothetical protein
LRISPMRRAARSLMVTAVVMGEVSVSLLRAI